MNRFANALLCLGITSLGASGSFCRAAGPDCELQISVGACQGEDGTSCSPKAERIVPLPATAIGSPDDQALFPLAPPDAAVDDAFAGQFARLSARFTGSRPGLGLSVYLRKPDGSLVLLADSASAARAGKEPSYLMTMATRNAHPARFVYIAHCYAQ